MNTPLRKLSTPTRSRRSAPAESGEQSLRDWAGKQ